MPPSAFTQEEKLRIALPSGSLKEATINLFEQAGFEIIVPSRSAYPTIDDEELAPILLRAQEIPRYVAGNHLDCGLTGHDWVVENQVEVVEVADLVYAKQSMRPVRWVLAAKEDGPIKTVHDLEGKLIATEVVNITKDFLARHGVSAKVEFSWGATEAKVPHLVDAIVDVTETGSSLRANQLKVIDTVLTSTTRFIANRQAMRDEWKRRKIEDLVLLLKGTIEAEGMSQLRVKTKNANANGILEAMHPDWSPAIIPAEEGFVWIDSVVPEKTIRQIAPQMKRLGAILVIETPVKMLMGA